MSMMNHSTVDVGKTVVVSVYTGHIRVNGKNKKQQRFPITSTLILVIRKNKISIGIYENMFNIKHLKFVI